MTAPGVVTPCPACAGWGLCRCEDCAAIVDAHDSGEGIVGRPEWCESCGGSGEAPEAAPKPLPRSETRVTQ